MVIPAYQSILGSIKEMTRSIKVIVGIEMFTAFFIAMSAPFYVVYATQVVQLNTVQWGLIMFYSGLLGIILAIPLGGLVDKIGPRKMILIGMALVPVCVLGFMYTSGFYTVAVVICGLALCNNIMIPAFSTIIANTVPRNLRGRMYSLMGERGVMMSFGNFWGGGFLIFPPAALGSLVGGYIYKYNHNIPWIITSAAMFISFILVYMFVPEPKDVQE
jgi:MFS family permease